MKNFITLICVASAIVFGGGLLLHFYAGGSVSADAPAYEVQPPPAQQAEPGPVDVRQSILDGMAKLQDQAYYTARRVVQSKLKSPSSAKFSTPGLHEGTGISPYGFYQWQASGWVDAKNPFGVMLRYEWYAVVQYRNSLMDVAWVRVGDSEFGSRPDVAQAPNLVVKQ